MASFKFCETFLIKIALVTAFPLNLMDLDQSGLKIDLKSIIESKTPLIIDSEFWDRFRTLVRAPSSSFYLEGSPRHPQQLGPFSTFNFTVENIDKQRTRVGFQTRTNQPLLCSMGLLVARLVTWPDK